MDKFVHSDNIMLNRRDLFATLQDMMQSNLAKNFKGIYKREPYKIICHGKGGGLLAADDYRVTGTGTATVTIAPGVATGQGDALIYNGESKSMDVSSLVSGTYHVCAKYKQTKSLTGKEVMLPPKGSINTSTLHTVLRDICEITVSADDPGGSDILLAIAHVGNGVVYPDKNTGALNADIFVDTEDVALPVASVQHPDWGSTGTLYIKVGNEYIGIDADDGDKIIERGAYGTAVEHHSIGDTVIFPAILDMRQLSLIEMNYSAANLGYIGQGMIKIGESIRSIVTRNIREPLSAPLVEIAADPIIWLNRSHAMGIITPEMQNAYYALSTSYVSIANLRAEIADIGNRLIGASESDEASLYAEQRSLHVRLIEALNNQYAQLSALSNAQMANSLQNIHNSFALIVNVAAGAGEDTPVQYEAEVERMAASSITRVSSDMLEYYYSKRIYPVSYSSNGDPIYPSAIDYASTVIRIPINIGEKVRLSIRAVDENNIPGASSADVTYVFRGYDDRQFLTFKAIYDMMIPEFNDLMQTINNYVAYIKDSVNRINSMESMISQYQGKVTALLAAVESHRQRLDELSPLVGVIPYVTSIREFFTPTPTPPPRPPVIVADEIARAIDLAGKFGSGDTESER